MKVRIQKEKKREETLDDLRRRLKKWEKEKVKPQRKKRGYDEGNIWTIEQRYKEEQDEKARLKKEAEEAKLNKDKQIQNTIDELYKRILKVEKLSDRIGQSGIMKVGTGGE